MAQPSHRLLRPTLSRPEDLRLSIGGWIGERIRANEQNWLIPAPSTNQGMIRMFANRLNPYACNLPGDNRMPVPWAGEFAGKYLLSAVQSLTLTRSVNLEAVVGRFVADLIATQGLDGSLGLPLPWDLWGQYHVLLGLLRWYEHTGDSSALLACQRAADLACARYLGRVSAIASDNPADAEKNQAIAHGVALLYEFTGIGQYLDLVHSIEFEWTQPPTGGNFLYNAIHGHEFFQGSRPRWESLHDVQAIGELYLITGQGCYRQAFEQVWNSIRSTDRHATGGFSSGEGATGNPYDPRYVETCATVAWMALSIDMLRITASSMAADELELSLFNAILGAQSPDGRLWTYHTPMGGIPVNGISPANRLGYRVPACYDLEWQTRDWYPQMSCCAANGPRGIGCLSEWAVMQSVDSIFLNYFGPMKARLSSFDGTPVMLTQNTNYPAEGFVEILVDVASESTFPIQLRIPGWSKNTVLTVNGLPTACAPGTYCQLNRKWTSGDVIHLQLDMSVRVDRGARDAQGLTVAYRGPLLLALDSNKDSHNLFQPPRLQLLPTPSVSAKAGGPQQITFQSSQGPVTLCDFASAGQSRGGSLEGRLNLNRLWQFSRSDQTIIAERIQLRPDGSIQGYAHPNEARWAFDGDVLTFYSQSGAASTRFTLRLQQHGKAVLSGRSLLDPHVRHLLSEVDLNVANKAWQFRRHGTPGTILLPSVMLLPGGHFSVPTHQNESNWLMDGQNLVFCDANGVPSTRFTSLQMHNGRAEWQGVFLFDTSIIHELVEINPDVTAMLWRFVRKRDNAEPEILADKVRLLPNGEIDGYSHADYARWEYGTNPATLLFRASNGAVSMIFHTLRSDQGAMRFEGTFESALSIPHELAESAPGWDFDSSYISWLPFQE